MKKKKLKKIVRDVFYDFERTKSEEIKIKELNQLNICEYDKEISDKTLKFILNLAKIQDKINIEYNSDYINIYCSLGQFYKKNNNYNVPTKEESIEISINKEGFKIRKDYGNNISYKDTNLLEIIKPILYQRYCEISRRNLIEIIDEVLVVTNLSRENNLDNLLNN